MLQVLSAKAYRVFLRAAEVILAELLEIWFTEPLAFDTPVPFE